MEYIEKEIQKLNTEIMLYLKHCHKKTEGSI